MCYPLKLLQFIFARFTQFDWSIAGEGRKKWPIFWKKYLKIRKTQGIIYKQNRLTKMAQFDWFVWRRRKGKWPIFGKKYLKIRKTQGLIYKRAFSKKIIFEGGLRKSWKSFSQLTVAGSRILIGQFIKYFSEWTVDIFRVRCIFYCSSEASHVLAGKVYKRISQDAHLAWIFTYRS